MIKPLRLTPTFKDYIWGGDILKKEYGKQTPYDITAESWELSCHEDGESRICGGEFDGKTLSEVIEHYKKQGINITGTNCDRFDRFPVWNSKVHSEQQLTLWQGIRRRRLLQQIYIDHWCLRGEMQKSLRFISGVKREIHYGFEII